MPLCYHPAPASGYLRQGEVLVGVVEHRADLPVGPAEGEVGVIAVEHPLVVVMTNECDLLHDRQARDGGAATAANSLQHVLLCDGYRVGDRVELRGRLALPGGDIAKRVEGNQDERYHCFAGDSGQGAPTHVSPFFVIDFRRHFAVPTEQLYQGVTAGLVQRLAVVPPIHLHDLIHRFYGYLSRVAVP